MLLIFCITAKLLPFQRITKSKGRISVSISWIIIQIILNYPLINFISHGLHRSPRMRTLKHHTFRAQGPVRICEICVTLLAEFFLTDLHRSPRMHSPNALGIVRVRICVPFSLSYLFLTDYTDFHGCVTLKHHTFRAQGPVRICEICVTLLAEFFLTDLHRFPRMHSPYALDIVRARICEDL